jgi:hypothetical protein
MKKLEILELIVFVVGIEVMITTLVIWWNQFIKVQEYLLIW